MSTNETVKSYETFFNLVDEFLKETPDQIYDSVADCLLAHVFKNISERRGETGLKRSAKMKRFMRDIRLRFAGFKP